MPLRPARDCCASGVTGRLVSPTSCSCRSLALLPLAANSAVAVADAALPSPSTHSTVSSNASPSIVRIASRPRLRLFLLLSLFPLLSLPALLTRRLTICPLVTSTPFNVAVVIAGSLSQSSVQVNCASNVPWLLPTSIGTSAAVTSGGVVSTTVTVFEDVVVKVGLNVFTLTVDKGKPRTTLLDHISVMHVDLIRRPRPATPQRQRASVEYSAAAKAST